MNLKNLLPQILFLVLIQFIGFSQKNDSDLGYIQPLQTEATKRYCLTLELKDDPELIEEYESWHRPDNIWQEVTEGIKSVGIIDSEIYRSGTQLFMILTVPADFDFEKQMTRLAELPRQAEWEAFMSKFQASDPNASSSEKWVKMKRIFKLSPIEEE